MGKYLLLWEVERTRVPVDAKERAAGFKMLLGMVKKDIESGKTKDWGAFLAGHKGYSITEGTEVEVMTRLEQYAPFVHFEVHPIGSIAQVDEMIKVLSR